MARKNPLGKIKDVAFDTIKDPVGTAGKVVGQAVDQTRGTVALGKMVAGHVTKTATGVVVSRVPGLKSPGGTAGSVAPDPTTTSAPVAQPAEDSPKPHGDPVEPIVRAARKAAKKAPATKTPAAKAPAAKSTAKKAAASTSATPAVTRPPVTDVATQAIVKKAAKKAPAKKATAEPETAIDAAANPADVDVTPADLAPVLAKKAPSKKAAAKKAATTAPAATPSADTAPGDRLPAKKATKAAAKKAPAKKVPLSAEELAAGAGTETITPVGTRGADVGTNPDTRETGLDQVGTEPLVDPATRKAVASEARTLGRASDSDKG